MRGLLRGTNTQRRDVDLWRSARSHRLLLHIFVQPNKQDQLHWQLNRWRTWRVTLERRWPLLAPSQHLLPSTLVPDNLPQLVLTRFRVMLTAPTRGVASPNPKGTVALFTKSQYSFEEESSSTSWQLIDLKTGEISDARLNASEVNEVVWIPDTDTGIVYINGTNEEIPGGVTLWIGDITKPSERYGVTTSLRIQRLTA